MENRLRFLPGSRNLSTPEARYDRDELASQEAHLRGEPALCHGRFAMDDGPDRTVDAARRQGRKLIANGIDMETFRPGDRDHARRALDLPLDGTIVLISAHSSFKPPEPMLDVLRTLNLLGRLTVVCLAKTEPAESWSNATVLHRPRQYDPAQMALYYQAADAYLQIAKAEAFGKAIVEAMACGTPVVANAVAAVPDLIRNRETGMLVSSLDPSLTTPRLSRSC